MKCTRRKQHKSLKKTRKHRFRLILKGGTIDEETEFENPPEINLKEYFCGSNSYMVIKSDLTKVIHKLPEIRNGCLMISRYLQSNLFEKWTPMLEYVFSQLDISTINKDHLKVNDEIIDELKKIFNKIKSIVDVNKDKPFDRTTLPYYDEFTKHLELAGITAQDISNISQVFYRFYLKGGSAMLFIIHQYQTFMQGDKLSPEEIEELLGGYSDFDFNFIVNPYLPREPNNPIHHNKIRELAKNYIFIILQNAIYSGVGDMFRNDDLVKKIAQLLLEHSPQIKIDTEHYPLNIAVYPNPNQIPNSEGKIPKLKIANDRLKNHFGEVQMTNLNIEHAFRMEKAYRNNKFDLIRLLSSFMNITKPIECKDAENYKLFISGELIDVSIPHFDSHEVFDKWIESSSIVPINNIYVYNLSSIIHDLEQVIAESIQKKDTTKLAKREKRLKFFNDFACILPQLVNPDIGISYENVCISLFNEIIENERSFLTKENKNDLTNKLIGIYINFPQFIYPEKRTIFLLLKQYFKHTIDYTYDTTTELYEITTPFNKRMKFPDLEYSTANIYKPSFYTLFSLNPDRSIQSVYDIQKIVFEYAIHLINDMEKVYNTHELLQNKIKEAISALLIEFNNIYISINDNTIKQEIIIRFIESLNDVLINLKLYTINDNYAEYLTGLNIFVFKEKLHDIHIEKNKYTQQFMQKHYPALLTQSLLVSKALKNRNIPSKLVLKGGFLYDIYNSIQNAIIKNKYDFKTTTNDMDMFMFINQPYLRDEDIAFIYQSFINLKTHFEKRKDSLQRICMSINRQSRNEYVIQMIVYDYVPYANFSSDVFTNILKTIHPPPQNIYRIIESHTYELYIFNIYNHIEPNYYYGWAKPRYTLSDFIPAVRSDMKHLKPIEKWENFLKQLTETLKTQTDVYQQHKVEINIRDLYVDSLLDIKKTYDEIMTSNKDVLKKEKYLNRMVGYSNDYNLIMGSDI